MRRCPDASGTGCVQLSPLPAMRRCPDASGTGCVQLNSDASLPGCVRNWMRPANRDRRRKLDASSYLLSQRCVAARMRPKLDASSSQRCVAVRMRPETGCVQSTAMRRCPDASGTGCVQLNSDASLPGWVRNWMRPAISRCGTGCVQNYRPAPSDASLPGCVRIWMRPVNAAMRRCPDASGTGCVQLNSDASLPG
jgi:hypothetical protein